MAALTRNGGAWMPGDAPDLPRAGTFVPLEGHEESGGAAGPLYGWWRW
jgi:hypothetical protein